MNNIDNINAEIRLEVVRHAAALNRIADKYKHNVANLLIGDCATSTVTLIDKGYGDDLVSAIDRLKELNNRD